MPRSATERRSVRVAVGAGANLGDAEATVRTALDALAALPQTTGFAASSLYRSAPVDADGPDFVNAVAVFDTPLAPLALLAALQAIEQRHGRERPYRNAPRTLDLDLLLYGDAVIARPELVVPHPRLHQRAFALVPLAEVAADTVVPGQGPVKALLPAVADQPLHRIDA